MGTSTCVIFYGVRFSVSGPEIEALEERSHSTQQAAKRVGLKHYWGRFGASGDEYYSFVGATLGLLGIENSLEVRLSDGDLRKLLDDTKAKLKDSGLTGEPAFYAQWMPDA